MDLSPDQRKQIVSDMADARKRKMANRSLIDSAFPSQGTPMGAHQGSQSASPTKQDYPDSYAQSPDMSLYNQFP